MPYVAQKPPVARTSAQLRAEIPGWGVDLDPADRPSFPREHEPSPATSQLPPQQPVLVPRERSIEHAHLTPAFGTAQPLHGLSGRVRRFAYRYSEARGAHWVLLIAGDRIEVLGSVLRSFATARPDNPFTQTGVLREHRHAPLASRAGRRVDRVHLALDPVVNGLPWAVGAGLVVHAVRRRRA